MIKLIYERPDIHVDYSAVSKVEMTIDDERSLDEMLEAYREFLNATGFNIQGVLEVNEPCSECGLIDEHKMSCGTGYREKLHDIN